MLKRSSHHMDLMDHLDHLARSIGVLEKQIYRIAVMRAGLVVER